MLPSLPKMRLFTIISKQPFTQLSEGQGKVLYLKSLSSADCLTEQEAAIRYRNAVEGRPFRNWWAGDGVLLLRKRSSTILFILFLLFWSNVYAICAKVVHLVTPVNDFKSRSNPWYAIKSIFIVFFAT